MRAKDKHGERWIDGRNGERWGENGASARKKEIKLTVDVCPPPALFLSLSLCRPLCRPLCRLSVSMTPSDAFFIIHSIIRRCAWQALLHIYIYQPKRVEPDKRVPDNPSRTYVNILNNALLYTPAYTLTFAGKWKRERGEKKVRTYEGCIKCAFT